MRALWRVAVGAVLAVLVAGAAHAGCPAEGCLTKELRDADAELNRVYGTVAAPLEAHDRASLRTEQRTWILERDAACGSRYVRGSIEDWLRNAAADEQRASCVLARTKERIAGLARRAPTPPRLGGSEPAARLPNGELPRIATEARPNRDPAEYQLVSAHARAAGKWYFEATIDPSRVTPALETLLVIGAADAQGLTGVPCPVRQADLVVRFDKESSVRIVGGRLGELKVPSITVGIAADLDAGRLYERQDGVWRDGEPGSGRGRALRVGPTYRFQVTAGIPVRQLTEAGILRMNFGEQPFTHDLPTGYAPVRGAPLDTAALPRSVVPPTDAVDGRSQAEWSQAYWHWVRSFGPGRDPAEDAVGARCAERQQGPVWFLPGGTTSAPLVRQCRVPRDRHLFFPVLVTLAEAKDGNPARCPALRQALDQLTRSATDLRAEVDYHPVPQFALWRQATDCFVVRSDQGERPAMSDGYWLMLHPLSLGDHVIEFGGRYKADGFSKEVRYLLRVE
jgi:uncharacterized protein YecT (DUF1311 family)